MSGQATGQAIALPPEHPHFPYYQISWNNLEPEGLPYEPLPMGLLVDGDFDGGFNLQIHSSGNVHGDFLLQTGATITLSGSPAVVVSYAGWHPDVIQELENKAATNAVVNVVTGSPSFALTFQAIPEPSSTALFSGAAVLALTFSRRRPYKNQEGEQAAAPNRLTRSESNFHGD